MSRATTSGPVSDEPGLDGVARELGEDRGHRLVEVDLHDRAARDVVGDAGVGHVLRRVGLELLEEDALGGDLAQRLTVGRARHRQRDRAGGAVPRQPDHPHVVAEVLAAELRADPEDCVSLKTSSSSSRSRNPCADRDPDVGRLSR